MGIRSFFRAAIAAWTLCHSLQVVAQHDDFHIVHAEKITLETIVPAANLTRAAHPPAVRLGFNAYGKRFELELESNHKLLTHLPTRQRNALGAYRLLKGKVSGVPGSWARLTRTPSGDYGAIWDGRDLYTIAPAGTVSRALRSPVPAGPSESVIYRQSDTSSSSGQAFCEVVEPDGGNKSSSLIGTSYKGLIEELQATVGATDLRGQIEIALVGDNEFAGANPVDPQGALLARLNLVDEIFSEQVGITVIATELRASTGSVDPFTTTDPSSLLEQLANYRDATPAVRSRGIAHLLTGTDLDGNTVGIAYRGSLCDPRLGVSLSEGRGSDITTSSLIMAHEIGHNFGAPHDGAAGACSTTPQNFLMSPTLNGSGQFSACSVAEMQPRIAAATCIAPATTFADAAITNTVGSVEGILNENFPLIIEVTGTGTLPVRNARVEVTLPSAVSIVSNSLPSSLCTYGATLICQVGPVSPMEVRQISLQLRGYQPGSFSGSASIVSDNDRYAANNRQAINFRILESSDGEIRFNAPEYSGATRIPMDFDLTVQTRGARPLTNAQVSFSINSMTILSISSDQGTCTITGTSANCALGTLAAPGTVGLRIRASGQVAGQVVPTATFSADNDSVYWNNLDRRPFVLAPTVDVGLSPQQALPPVLVGAPLTTTATFSSLGTQPVNDLALRVFNPSGAVLDSVTSSLGSCVLDSEGYICQIGTLAAGQSGVLTINARGTEVRDQIYIVTVVVDNQVDDFLDNNITNTALDVRRQRDLEIGETYAWGYERSPLTLSVPVRSIGLSPVQNVTFTVSVPTGFTISAATLPGASCTIAGQSATCAGGSFAAGYQGFLSLTMLGVQSGDYSATVSLAAASDGFSGNDSGSFDIYLQPFVDTMLQLPTPPAGITVDEVFSLEYKVTQNWNPGANFRFVTSFSWPVEIVSYEAPFQCGIGTGGWLSCSENVTLPANSVTTIKATFRVRQRTAVDIRAYAYTDSDPAYANNEVQFNGFADRQGDASISPSNATVATTVGQLGSASPIRIVASRAIDEGTLEIDLGAQNIANLIGYGVSIGPSGGVPYCMPAGTNKVLCNVGTVLAGESREVTVQVSGQTVGTTTGTLRLLSPNDVDSANNVASLQIAVTAPAGTPTPTPTPAPTPAPAPGPASGSGGGGGRIEMSSLLALLLLAYLTHRRRRVTVQRVRTRV